MSAHQMAVETQQELRRLPGNNRCVDCDAPYPQWATVSYGTFMCLECSGRHRGLGVHISFVRSVTMDSWTDKQILQMQRGGNDTFREAFAAAGVPTTLSIQQKYNTPQAEAYRARLTALVEGRSATPLPRWDPSCIKPASGAGGSSPSFAGGDTRGVEALKGESEEDYVARQMRLREEARARMAAKFGGGGMQGIGSGGETRAPVNNGGIADLSSAFGFLTTTVASAASSAVNLVKDQDLTTKVSSGWSYVQNSLGDPALTENVKSTATTGWSALTNATTAVWQKAVNAPPAQNGLGEIPRLNTSLAPTGKYSGVGSDSRSHNNDSWLDSQLSSSSPKANSFGGSSVTAKPLHSSAHSASFTSSSSSSSSFPGQSLKSTPAAPSSAPSSFQSSTNNNRSNGFSSTGATPLSAPLPPPAPAPAAPAPPKEKKKDVDFFAEFGF